MYYIAPKRFLKMKFIQF